LFTFFYKTLPSASAVATQYGRIKYKNMFLVRVRPPHPQEFKNEVSIAKKIYFFMYFLTLYLPAVKFTVCLMLYAVCRMY